MRTSIRFRMLLILNLVVLTTVGALGVLAAQVAGDVVEQRLVSEVAQNTAGLLESQSVPFTDTLMGQLKQLFDVEFAILRSHDRKLIATSLPEDLRDALQEGLTRPNLRDDLQIGPGRYRVGVDTVYRAASGGPALPVQIVALVPVEQFHDARRRASRRIGLIALLAAIGASGLTLLLSRAITRPIGDLADEMDHTACDDAPKAATHSRRGPTELIRLADSFDALIGRLNAARADLARAERLAALGKVAASAVHELRNPLSGIKMNGRILQDELRQAGLASESLDLMCREVERMDLYLQELMNLATRKESHPAAPAPPTEATCRIAEVAADVLGLLEGRCRHSHITAETDFAASAPPARIDPMQLRQVLMNLLVNAIEAMPAGGVIRLSVSAEADAVRLAVADSGAGVAAADGEDIFDAFITGKPNGAGLGLYLCRQVVDAHGGRIGYESSSSGATFFVDLPPAEPVE